MNEKLSDAMLGIASVACLINVLPALLRGHWTLMTVWLICWCAAFIFRCRVTLARDLSQAIVGALILGLALCSQRLKEPGWAEIDFWACAIIGYTACGFAAVRLLDRLKRGSR